MHTVIQQDDGIDVWVVSSSPFRRDKQQKCIHFGISFLKQGERTLYSMINKLNLK